jgi:membrane-associated phospholipid phosphatase
LSVQRFFSTLPRHIIACFKGRMIAWHIVAILLTFVCVAGGLDWGYFLATRSPGLRHWMFPAVIVGGLLPLALPVSLLVLGGAADLARVRRFGWAIVQAELIGALVAAGYKAVTGRAHPLHLAGEDLSRVFKFGLFRGGVFWGWPSSHTTVAFAMAVTVFTLLAKPRWVGYTAIAYACYVGIGVSVTIHWLSDFLAGAIFGTVIGVVVGKCFPRSQIQPSGQ